MSVHASEDLARRALPFTDRVGHVARRARDSMRGPRLRHVPIARRYRGMPSFVGTDTPVLVVSPHLDDAVLSAFAFLQRHDTTVLTVFTGSPRSDVASDWDRDLGHDNGVEIMRKRLTEDDKALSSLPVDTVRLPLLENGYRDGPMPDEDVAAMRAAVREWFETTGGRGVMLAPAGAGAVDNALYRRRWNTTVPLLRVPGGGLPHPDHIVVRDAVVTDALNLGATVVAYEELPYRWTGRAARAVEQLAASHDCVTTRFDVEVDQDRKTAAVECYASQTPGLFRPWVRDIRAVMPSYERFWKLAPATP